jgi:hypothetical protein
MYFENYMGNLFLILLVLFLIGGLPTWPHSRNWGYLPSSIIGTILTVYIVLVLVGYISIGF